jgi:hypothetical protein
MVIEQEYGEGECTHSTRFDTHKYACVSETEFSVRHYSGDWFPDNLGGCPEEDFISESTHDLNKCYGSHLTTPIMDVCMEDVGLEMKERVDRFYRTTLYPDTYFTNKDADMAMPHSSYPISTQLDCAIQKVLVLEPDGDVIQELGEGDEYEVVPPFITMTVKDIHCSGAASVFVNMCFVLIVILFLYR